MFEHNKTLAISGISYAHALHMLIKQGLLCAVVHTML